MKIDQNGQTRFRLHPDKGAIQVPDNYICSITMHASKGEANSQIHRISSCISAIRTLPGSTARQQVSDFGMRAADLRWTHTDGRRRDFPGFRPGRPSSGLLRMCQLSMQGSIIYESRFRDAPRVRGLHAGRAVRLTHTRCSDRVPVNAACPRCFPKRFAAVTAGPAGC